MFVLTPTQQGLIASSPVSLPLTCYNTTVTATTTTTAAAATTETTSNDNGDMDNNGDDNDDDKTAYNARRTRVMYESEGG